MSKPQPAAERQSPAEARAEAFEHAVPEAFFLKGVSFDERQQNIEAIQKGASRLCAASIVTACRWRAVVTCRAQTCQGLHFG